MGIIAISYDIRTLSRKSMRQKKMIFVVTIEEEANMQSIGRNALRY